MYWKRDEENGLAESRKVGISVEESLSDVRGRTKPGLHCEGRDHVYVIHYCFPPLSMCLHITGTLKHLINKQMVSLWDITILGWLANKSKGRTLGIMGTRLDL